MRQYIFTIIFILLTYPSCSLTAEENILQHHDNTRLETYEDLTGDSQEFNIFHNLIFNFTCENKSMGFYADIEYNCTIFHICDDIGLGVPVICPLGTVFDQKLQICSDAENVDCQFAEKWYFLNDLPFSDDVTEQYGINVDEENIPSVEPLKQPE
ncbi:uncharacterized protein [Prorops nasuta]|uniref:uncharacterized protein n=1 Tax=Prorops nasuta TaxID=863751 RepID=UPI0034CE74E0